MKFELALFIKNNKILNKIFRFVIKRKQKSSSNVFVLIKKDGTKIYNPKIKNLEIHFGGINNYFEIKEPFNIKEKVSVTFLRDNAKLTIGNGLFARKLKIVLDKNTNISIGNYFGVNDVFMTTNGGIGTSIKIGNSCMFSLDVTLRTSDGHVIYDIENKEVINASKDITIENRVWLCAKSTVLKGAKLSANTVVGYGAIVVDEFSEKNCIIAGIPAKIVKENIMWEE